MALLQVDNLNVTFETMRGPLNAVEKLSFHLDEGETLGIVGESGSGKSVSSLAIMGLLPSNSFVEAMTLSFSGKNLLDIPLSERRALRGGDMAMIFQDPMSSLNPSYTVGFQLMETLKLHQNLSKAARKQRAMQLLDHVGIPEAKARLRCYPHQLSGGMCQRVMIAMAVACKPRLLIADEPTTALDVTIQAQILRLLKQLQKEENMAMILITHDIGVVAENADRILVMYAGQVVEDGPIDEVMQYPVHPYTEGLLASMPSMHGEREHRSPLPSIPGVVPDLAARPSGCQMHPRCSYVQTRCREEEPRQESINRQRVRCFYPLNTRRQL